MWTDFLRQIACDQPNKVALILADEGIWLSYAQLDHEASRWAATFARLGVRRADRVVLLARNCLEHITMFFGCAKLAATFVPLNTMLAKWELEEQLARLEASLFYGKGPCTLAAEVAYRDLDTEGPDKDPIYEAVKVQDLDCLLLLFTSGSTGLPKGVILHAKMLLWNMINTHVAWGLNGNDVAMAFMPFCHTGGYNVMLLPLLRLGGTLVMTAKFEANRVLELIDKEQVSVFFAVPTMFHMMRVAAGFEKCKFSHVRFCISGGAPCQPSMIAAYHAKGVPLKQGFGLTEVGPNCFYLSNDDAVSHPESVGRPMPHLEVLLLKEGNKPAAMGEVAELCFKGPTVCGGYWHMIREFDAVYRDSFFHSGDLARMDEAGFYYVVGRKKDMFISGGENVYPSEVVRQMMKFPPVLDAVVLPVRHKKWGEVGFAFVRCNEKFTLTALRTFLNSLLPRFKHPHYLLLKSEFPLLANGKVDMDALRELVRAEVSFEDDI